MSLPRRAMAGLQCVSVVFPGHTQSLFNKIPIFKHLHNIDMFLQYTCDLYSCHKCNILDLTHISMAFFLWDKGKKCRPRSDQRLQCLHTDCSMLSVCKQRCLVKSATACLFSVNVDSFLIL